MVRVLISFVTVALCMIGGCTKKENQTAIRIDGSSTVFPLSEAVAEEFQKDFKSKVTIGVSGTGGGFKQFCRGKLAITGASRTIESSEKDLCAQNKVEFIELPIALDGIAVIVHPKNTWLSNITKEELKQIWEPEAQGKVMKWSQVNNTWPDKNINLFAPGVDSGTYDYFTEAIVGKEHASRGDITSSEDDNVLVQGVATDENAMAFVGLSYYLENKDKLKLVSVDGVEPSFKTVQEGSYKPLSRPLFLYVQKESLKEKNVRQFIAYYLKEMRKLASEIGFVSIDQNRYEEAIKSFEASTMGDQAASNDPSHS